MSSSESHRDATPAADSAAAAVAVAPATTADLIAPRGFSLPVAPLSGLPADPAAADAVDVVDVVAAPADGKENDADADLLMAELLDLETSASIASSSAMLRLGASSVARNLSSMQPDARGGAHALCFFPASFDACAAAAMLGRNVHALVTLISTNVLVVSNAGSKPRFSLNPIVKHVLPALRAQEDLKKHRLRQRIALKAQIERDRTQLMGAVAPTSDVGNSLLQNGGDLPNGTFTSRDDLNRAFGFEEDSSNAVDMSWDPFRNDSPDYGLSAPDLAAEAFGYEELDDASSSSSAASDSWLPSRSTLRARFVAHFGQVLATLSDNPDLFRNGSDRLRAMRMFDTDRENIMHAMRLAESMGTKVHIDFLRKAAQVLRFCTDAKSRVSVFQSALNTAPDVSASVTPPANLHDPSGTAASVLADESFMGATAPQAVSPYLTTASPLTEDNASPTPHELESSSLAWLQEFGAGFCPELAAKSSGDAKKVVAEAEDESRLWKNHARVHLALGEAFCDMLDLERAEAPLQKARDLMDARSRRSECHNEAVFLALPNLLLAEIKASKGDVAEAKDLLYYALSMLSQAGLSESTFTVNAMNTLVGVHLTNRNYEEAFWTSNRMVDVLGSLGGGSYRGMPIYADALGTLATVHLNRNQPLDSERVFCEALEVVHEWIGRKDWDKAPFEHCQDLDIWLLEGLARACRDQGKIVQADGHMAEAERRRVERGLSCGETTSSSNSGESKPTRHCPGYMVDESSALGVAREYKLPLQVSGSQHNWAFKPDPDGHLTSKTTSVGKLGFPQHGTPVPRPNSSFSFRLNRPYMRHIY